MEPIWKATRKHTTHNKFYKTVLERDNALKKTFRLFQRNPVMIYAHVARWKT